MICTIQDGNSKFSVHHTKTEREIFSVDRPRGVSAYTLWHFSAPVEIRLGKETVAAESDACITFSPDVPQHFICREPLQYDCIHFDEKSAELWLRCGLEFEHIYYPHPSTYISNSVRVIENEYSARKDHYEAMIDAKLAELFIQTARACSNHEIQISRELTERFHHARHKMLDNLGENWTVARMADELNISPSYFHSVYKKIYGVSPTQDLINARIASAKYILQYSRDPIAVISKSLGYNSPYHFTRQFRQITGESPSKYRSTNG